MLKVGKNDNISNEDYHADRDYISSSGLKLLLKSPKDFHAKYILGQKEEVTNEAALRFGTVAHLMILEPHLFLSDVVTYDGTRRGKVFDAFAEANKGKHIMNTLEMNKLTTLYEAYTNDKYAPGLMVNAEVEATFGGSLGSLGVKVRCDAINAETGIILDVKTTSQVNNTELFKDTVSQMYYDLSAALYCDVCSAHYGRPFDFYFIVLSKRSDDCKVYKASKQTIENGHRLMHEAKNLYERCKLTGVWEHDTVSLAAKEETNDDKPYVIEEV